MTNTKLPIYFSNANFGVRSLFTPPERIWDFANEAGFDGVEVVPLGYSAERYISAINNSNLVLGSLHQSFRASQHERNACAMIDEVGLNLTDRIMRLPIIGPLVIGPDMNGSARFMAKVQSQTGLYVPGTFYPQEDERRDRLNLHLANTTEKLFRPTDHVARLVGASSVSEMLSVTKDRGYTGLVLDTYHARRQYPYTDSTVSHTEVSLGQMASDIVGVHVSLGRTEFESTQPHIPTRPELIKVLGGNFTSQLGEILTEIKSNKIPPKYIVVESTIGSLRQIAGIKSRTDALKAYTDLAVNLRGFFARAA